jgi:peroxiredoxin Q/BCP
MSEVQVQEAHPAPDFSLSAIGSEQVVHDGHVQLSTLRGKIVVLYFYPKDETAGCVKEACSFRDANQEMQKRGVIVLGVSADDLPSHQHFADKYELPFPLLADTDATVAKLYGVKKGLFGMLGFNRETFLIDQEGIVRKIWRNVKPAGHAQEVLETIEALELSSPASRE